MVPRVVGSSPIFHPIFVYMVNVAQLVRALDCGSKGRGFEPHLSPIKEDKPIWFVLFLFYAIC